MDKLKISIISRSNDGWHQRQILNAAQKAGVDCDVINFTGSKDLKEQIEKAGDVIIWRASSLDHTSERASVSPYVKNKIFVNETIFKYPLVAYKYFQQNKLKANRRTSKYSIPTYRASNLSKLYEHIKAGDVSYPFIAKPNKGAMGIGVELVKSKEELESIFAKTQIKDYIFQNFINNTGDWRVIILGGRPLGALKRIAKKGAYLNNISRGATAIKEEDPEVLSSILDIAIKAASVFELRFCGVDVIKDEATGDYFVLEVNTAPQWDSEFGFQSIVGVNVADKLVEYAIQMFKRKAGLDCKLVDDYYKKAIDYDFSALFHFASRSWLWTGDKWSRDKLDELKSFYIGGDETSLNAKLSETLECTKEPVESTKKKYRNAYLNKYRMLPAYNVLLFKVIFMESIYGIDIRPAVGKLVKDDALIKMFNELISDHDAIRVLSTYAINYFYLLKNYYKNKVTLSTLVLLDPYEIIEIANGYNGLIKSGELKANEAIKLRIYLLTHAVLGQTRFYQKKVGHKGYKDIVKEIEKTVYENYYQITLDNKLEFLVCSELCNYKSRLRKLILDEAEHSFSWAGNFVVDSHNENSESTHSLRLSEHRNILYIMACTPFSGGSKPKKIKSENVKYKIGRLARIKLEEIGLNRILARVDTGATSSSIHCTDVTERDGLLSFKVLDESNPSWNNMPVTVRNYKKTIVKNPAGGVQQRYSVLLTVDYDGRKKSIYFTLANRGVMLYPVLLGRNFLHKDYIVDVDRQFVSEQVK